MADECDHNRAIGTVLREDVGGRPSGSQNWIRFAV